MNLQGFRWIWLPTRLAIYERDSWTCLACSRPGRWKKGRGRWHDCRPEALSLDHVVPKVLGGSNGVENLVTVCVSCNSARGDLSVEEWKPELVDAFLCAVASPVDRRMGIELARLLDPAFGERVRRVGERRRAERERVRVAA